MALAWLRRLSAGNRVTALTGVKNVIGKTVIRVGDR